MRTGSGNAWDESGNRLGVADWGLVGVLDEIGAVVRLELRSGWREDAQRVGVEAGREPVPVGVHGMKGQASRRIGWALAASGGAGRKDPPPCRFLDFGKGRSASSRPSLFSY